MAGLTNEEQERLIKRLSGSGIRKMYRKLTLPKLGKYGKQLRDYIESEEFSSDVADGKGVFIAGGLDTHPHLLPVLAKEEVLMGNQSFFLYLPELLWALTGNDNQRTLERVRNTQNLFIAWFQTGDDFPFTPAENYHVVQFIVNRMETGQRTSFSACKRLQDCDWWPKELRGLLNGKVLEYYIRGEK